MGVPLQLTLGVVLTLASYSFSHQRNLRQIREAPSSRLAAVQNVTEINNRDLNKIIKTNPKTETLDSRTKTLSNLNNFEEFPLKLGKSEQENQELASARINETESAEERRDSKESENKDEITKSNKEKFREDSSKATDNDASKFWSSGFHAKKNAFVIPPVSKIATVRTPEEAFEGTRHPSFDDSAELTTPPTELFDQKFKETVESVEQKLDDIDLDSGERQSEEQEAERSNEPLSVDDLLRGKPENFSLAFEKTKTLVNNETIDKNSIHKDLNIEQMKKIGFETIYNDTKVYADGISKEDTEVGTTEKINNRNLTTTNSTGFPVVTKKGAFLKNSVSQKTTTHLLSNNIETEFSSPIKATTRPTPLSTTSKHNISDNKLTASTINSRATRTELTLLPKITTTTVSMPISMVKTNISEQDNVIPLQFTTEGGSDAEISSEGTTTVENLKTQNHSEKEIETFLENVTTQTMPTTTSISETTTENDISSVFQSDSTTNLPEEGTTSFLVEINTNGPDTTSEISITTTISNVVQSDPESATRTSKSLANSIVTEQMLDNHKQRVEPGTEKIDLNTQVTIKNKLDSTTLNNANIENNIIQKVRDVELTTTEQTMPTTTFVAFKETTTLASFVEMVVDSNVTTPRTLATSDVATELLVTLNATEQTTKILGVNTSTTAPSTTVQEKLSPTTTEFTFVHIENTANKHTTLLPEVLSPNFNYSTSMAPDSKENILRKVVLPNYNITQESTNGSSTTSSISSEETSNIDTTTESGGDTDPTENSFTKDGSTSKGKIAAIAISSVGAVCLIILAGLLYVMKKRQRRLNYGPRCRPVSLDDYSIDNLSVYNSVRRKGGARMSKRSFGNPAFDDPVAPTHPLNFQALAKFSTNFEDIKAEFEEIPQIAARTSELPDGCDTKNRYANVIPLPETRVFLKQIDGYPNSDYINANYVTGPTNIKGYYIATQGPMQNTIDDFWRMIWEQQTKVILMLTHLVENGLEKCVDYLPESEVLECSRLFGDFQITLKRREVKEKYIISSLQLKNMVSNSWREVTHFWYLGWPEKGVPNEANSMIAFLIEARSYMKTVTIDKKNGIPGIQNGGTHAEHNPVVIHCSPGTGRTGVAIACDIAIREFETTRLVDIPKIVYRIRRDRANAVQTKEQYIFIYKVVSLYATKLTGGALENP